MSLLTRDQILQAEDTRTTDVPVPEWGGTVRVKELTGQQRDQYELYVNQNLKSERLNARAHLVALCAVDEAGKRLFTSKDIIELGKKSAAALDRVWEAARILSGIGPEAEAQAAEGFGDDQSELSSSD